MRHMQVVRNREHFVPPLDTIIDEYIREWNSSFLLCLSHKTKMQCGKIQICWTKPGGIQSNHWSLDFVSLLHVFPLE